MTKLLDRGFDVNHRGRTGCTSLFHAALHGQTDVVKWLIRRGASSDFRDRFAQTPLHYAAECDNGSCLAPFLSSGLKVDAVNDDGDQPIHIAAAAGRLEPLAFLLDNGANIDAKGFNGYTPLLYAITKGQHNIVSFLMSKGATLKVKSEGDYGANALEYAAQFGCPSIVRLLINRAPSYCAYWIEKHGDHFSPVHLACSKGNEEILKLLLDSAPASWRIDSATIKSHSRTPLHEAVKSSSVECIDMLLRNGASAIARDASGDTPLHYAASGGCTAGLGRLIDSLPRSCVETYVNFQSGAGRTPLMEAIIGGYERSVELLLREGASVTVKDRNGWSVMDLARKSGRPSILKALMDHSASIGDIHRSLSA
ncbi:ankyrin repeat-containing domain protein [Lineolata rhizophorae]|uniref:Ankyrin repeat-containing domain protein n=1 Tax=Lineolata rhizophorae TaxID=578093 RepID=A0A6A6NLM7_9PEZI|nr:ankyrin repeat-containing domain protein [Lineolata rhizophorae]